MGKLHYYVQLAKSLTRAMIEGEKVEGFIRAWCYFRYEVDGIKKQVESQGQ